MPSLKEVKTRIVSVQSTRKITSAMKMVASSKLHKAQQAIENMRPYEKQLTHIMSAFLSGMQGEFSSPYASVRKPDRVAIVVVSSNSSLCGGYNANVIRILRQAVADYQQYGVSELRILPFGRKVADVVVKAGFPVDSDHADLMEHPSYETAAAIVIDLMKQFAAGELDKVELIYHQFKSTASQILIREDLLPIAPVVEGKKGSYPSIDYIAEPSAEEILEEIIPKSLCLKLYTVLLDSLASEHASRVIAMQMATDNANDLLQELTLMYNKSRQQAITTELLDIVGGSMQ